MYSILFVEEGCYVLGGVLFAVLLNMKHLFAYLGPVYFVFLLKHYVLADSSSGDSWRAAAGRLVLLGGAVVAVCAASFGPFVAMGQMKQVRAGSSSSKPVTRQLLTAQGISRGAHTHAASS